MKRKRKPERVYICGPMSLHAKTDWGAANFNAAAALIRARGDIAVSPVELDTCLWGFDSRKTRKPPEIMSRKRLMSFDIGFVVPTCERIYVLRDWEKSGGGRAEIATALTEGLKIEFEPGATDPRKVCFWPDNTGLDGKPLKPKRKKRSHAKAKSKNRRTR